MFLFLAVSLMTASLGCTHRQLRHDHVMQARTLTTIYEQQVLDNLAMFSQNIDAVPFFATPSAGSAQVTDNGSIAASTLNGPLRTVLGPLGLSRANTESWTLSPIRDEGKLRKMREAYVEAVSGGVSLRKSNRRSPTSECLLRGTYCDHSIEVCSNSKAAFGELVFRILKEAADSSTPAPATIRVQAYSYNEDGRVSEIRTSTQDAETGKLVATPTVSTTTSADGLGDIQAEQQRALIRATLFPQ